MEQNWRKFENKLDTSSFCVSTLINRTTNISAMIDSGCLTYGLVPEYIVSRLELQRIPISPRPIEGWDGRDETSSNAIAYLTIDVGGQPHEAYLFIVPKLDYDMILGRPWMMGQKATFSFDHRYLIFESGAYAPRTEVEKSLELYQVGASAYSLWARDSKKRYGGSGRKRRV